MIWALVRKEVSQHGTLVVVLVLVALGAALVVRAATSMFGTEGSAFSGVGMALVTILPLACLILGHRLVVVEFRDKTQLFLEALPISRWKMIGVKYVLGLSCALACGLGMLAFTWWQVDAGEGKTDRFLQILSMRTGLWVCFVFSFFFMMGFLGRYRIPVFIVLYFALVLADGETAIPVGDFPPFAVVDFQTFGLERDDFPVGDLGWTAGIALGLTGMSFLLGLVREGSVASMLGERMSHKEKMVVGGLVAGAILSASTLTLKFPTPFELPGAVEEEREGVVVSVASPEEGSIDREVGIASLLVEEMVEAKRWIGAEEWPEIFVAERADDFEDGEFFRLGDLGEEPGVLVYADYRREGFPEGRFVRFVLQSCLEELSGGRVNREEKKWLASGFVRMWGEGERLGAPVGEWGKRIAKAREAVEQEGLEEEDLGRWLSYEKSVGEGKARAVAWVGLKVMGARYGEETVRKVLAAVVGRAVEEDVRATIYDWRNPVPVVFERVTGERFGDFVVAWREAIETGEEGG